MSDNFREFKSQGEENYSEQTKKSGNARKIRERQLYLS